MFFDVVIILVHICYAGLDEIFAIINTHVVMSDVSSRWKTVNVFPEEITERNKTEISDIVLLFDNLLRQD